MHRDVKLGLALGILVIGFAAAFCFPRQPAAEVAMSPAAGLKLAAVDEDIRQERRRTFVGDELSPPEQPTLAEAGPTIDEDLPPLQTAAMRAQAAQRSAPDPIRQEVPTPLEAPVGGLLVQTPVVAMPVFEPVVEETFYTVESGDTLSAVASKTLGSARKYEEIYEANRDVLATPNSLKIGMKLRIPHTAESVAKRQPDTSIPLAQKVIELPRRASEAPVDRRGMFSPMRPMQARSGESIAR
jgi:nucleoid-associated protein YgaU